MTTLPSLTGKELVAALERAGFRVIRIRGSHHALRISDGRFTTVAVHSGETVGGGLLSKILRDCKLTRAQLQELL